jgi:hypothetical protein
VGFLWLYDRLTKLVSLDSLMSTCMFPSFLAIMNVAPRNTLLATTSLRTCARRVRPTFRHLATQPPHPNLDPPPSASTQDLLDRLAREAKKNSTSGTLSGRSALGGDGKPYVGSVGPFPMGVGLGSNIRTKDWKKWKDLGVGGKGMGDV